MSKTKNTSKKRHFSDDFLFHCPQSQCRDSFVTFDMLGEHYLLKHNLFLDPTVHTFKRIKNYFNKVEQAKKVAKIKMNHLELKNKVKLEETGLHNDQNKVMSKIIEPTNDTSKVKLEETEQTHLSQIRHLIESPTQATTTVNSEETNISQKTCLMRSRKRNLLQKSIFKSKNTKRSSATATRITKSAPASSQRNLKAISALKIDRLSEIQFKKEVDSGSDSQDSCEVIYPDDNNIRIINGVYYAKRMTYNPRFDLLPVFNKTLQ